VYTVLKNVEEANPGVSLPNPKNLIRNVQRSVSSTKPREPAKHDVDFDLDQTSIDPGFLQADIRVPARVGAPKPTRSRILVFSTLQLLLLLHSSPIWAMDGTYSIVKKPFSVLYTIHGFIIKGSYRKQVPLVFVLMSRCTTDSFLAVFDALENIFIREGNKISSLFLYGHLLK